MLRITKEYDTKVYPSKINIPPIVTLADTSDVPVVKI